MGTWGPGSFENDTALDFLAGIESADGLKAFLQGPAADHDFRADATGAEQALAAADLVACMMGRPGADATGDVRTKAASFGEPDLDLLDAARNAVSGVMGGSELLELWGEADDPAAFNEAVTALMERLNPETDYLPPPAVDAEGAEMPQARCAFCNQPVARTEMVLIQMTNNMGEGIESYFNRYCHLPCLNRAVHPAHMFQKWVVSEEMTEAAVKRILGRE